MGIYSLFKAIHITSAILSICLLLLRSYWLIKQPEYLFKTSIRIIPHVIDSILLISAFTLLYFLGISDITENPWLLAKITGVILYIFCGLYLFKKANSKKKIYASLFISICIYMYIIQAAINKQIFPF